MRLLVGFPPGIVCCQVFVGNKFRLFAHSNQRRKMNWAFVCQILCNHSVTWSENGRKLIFLNFNVYLLYMASDIKVITLNGCFSLLLSQTKLLIRFLISWWWWPLTQQIHYRAVFAPGSCRWKCGPLASLPTCRHWCWKKYKKMKVEPDKKLLFIPFSSYRVVYHSENNQCGC